MDFYKHSTHAASLRTVEGLREYRERIHAESLAKLGGGAEWLSLEEAELIKRFYQAKISDVCSFLGLPKHVQVSRCCVFAVLYSPFNTSRWLTGCTCVTSWREASSSTT